MCQTNIVSAGGNKPLVNPVMAEIAFLCNTDFIVKGYGIVRACIDAGLASSAQIVIHDDNIVLSLADGLFWTSFGTRGIVAVPANVDVIAKIQFAVYHSRTIFTNRY